jgi:hypothetical protein
MAGCDDTRQLTETQRQAGYQQGRTGVQQAVRPFSGRPTLDNLLDYINRELYPAVRRTRDKVNDIYLPVVDNAPSGNPLGFYFSTNTANADPTAGRIRLNASPQDTATTMRVSQSNGRLVDVAAWLDVMSGSPTSPLGVVTLTDAINPGRFIRFDLTAMVDQGAYWDLTVAAIESSHDDPFVDGGAVVISFIPGVGGVTAATVPPSGLSPLAGLSVLGRSASTTGVMAAITATGRRQFLAANAAGTSVSFQSLSLIFPGATIYDVMAAPFNAVGDGTTDDTAAINAAIVAANSSPGVIYLGKSHRITAGLTAITSNNVVIRGRGKFDGGTLLRVDAAVAPTAVILFDGPNYCGVEDIWFRGIGTVYTSGSTVRFQNCLGSHVARIYISQMYNGVDIFECALTDIDQITFDDLYGEFGVRASGNGNSCHTTYISRCYGENTAHSSQVGSVRAWATGTAYVIGNMVVSNGLLYQAKTAGTSGATAPSGFPGTTISTAHTATVSDGGVSWAYAASMITWYLQDSYSTTFRVQDCAAVGGGYGLVVQDTLGNTPQFTRVNNLECDHMTLGGVKLDGGRQAEFNQLFVTSVLNGVGVEVTANQEGDWLFRDGFMFGVPFEGFIISAREGGISDFTICACGTRTANTYDAIRVDASVSHWNISDCTIGFAHNTAASTRYGISVASGCDNYTITGNRLLGHDTDAILNTPNRATTRIVRDNVPDDTTPGNSLDFDTSTDQYAYIGSTSTINLTPSGAVGVADISTLLCGGCVTLQPTADFDIDGFTVKPTGFWFDLVYRDTTTRIGTLNENTGGATTSIRNPGNTALTFSTQAAVRLRYQLSRWRVVGRSGPGFSLTDGDKGDITVSASGTTWTIDNTAVTLPKLATQATETVVANVSGATASPTAVALSTLVNNAVSLTYDSTNHRFQYVGTTTSINLTPTGAQGVVDISTLPCGGLVTLQPSGNFDIDGFTAKTNGFWFLLNYRDTTTRVGTLNENAGATTTSIRNPGNVAYTFTTQETIPMVYSNSRWRTATILRVSDGDKGDITVTSGGATWTIDNGVVSLAKMADLAQSRIIGRAEGAGTGVPTALTPTQVVAIIDGENATWTGTHSFTGASHTVNVSGDVAVTAGGIFRLTTNGTERLEVESDGAWQLGGDTGDLGAAILSQGSAAPPIWANRGDVVTRTTIIAAGSFAEANIVSLVVAAGTWVVGTTYEFYAHCEYVRSGAAASSHTVTIDAELNGTGMGITLGVLSGTQNSATASVLVHGTFTCSATGAGGTGRAAIAIDENILVGSTAAMSRWAGTSSPTLDTTASNTLSITVDFSAGVSGVSFVCQRAWIRRVV